MAKWKNSPELDLYVARLESLNNNTEECISDAIYDGAGIVADAIKAQIQNLPVAQRFASEGEKISTITSVQKAGLLKGFGISPMRKDGHFYNRKLGFDGYNGQKTKKYRNGVPNSIIARSIISGTSFREKNDFVGRAVNSKKRAAERKMAETLDQSIKKIMS